MPHPETEDAPKLVELPIGDHTNDLRMFLSAIREYLWLISLLVVVALLGAAYYYKTTPRIYESKAVVQVEQEERRVVKIEQVLKEDLRGVEILNTIAQKLRSRQLLERVLETNKLASLPEFYTVKDGSSVTKEKLLDRLEKMVKTSLRRNTRLIDIAVVHPSPRLAARIANSIVEQYMSQDYEIRSSTTKGAYTYLTDEAERLKKKLETSERALNDYQNEVGSVSMQQSQDILLPQLRELSSRLTQAKSETIRLKAAYDQVTKAGTNVFQFLDLPQIVEDKSVGEARTILAKSETDLALIQKRYKHKHPKYIQALIQIDSARTSLSNALVKASQSVRVAYENSQVTAEGLAKSLRDAEESALKLNRQAIRFNMLSREMESDRALFDSVLNRVKETSLNTEIQTEKIRVVQVAEVPTLPYSPRLSRTFGIALLAGLLAGGLLAFGLNGLDSSLKSVEEVEQYVGLPVLCAIARLKEGKEISRPLSATAETYSPGLEAFRTLRTSISMLGPEEGRRSFMFTSSFPKEGKTFCSLNCAASFAQQGLRTLLIDMDLRRPSVRQYMAVEDDAELSGVTDYLLGQKTLDEIILPDKTVPNLFWIPGGKTAPNPSELLAQGKFSALYSEALQRFDRIVVDSAPVHAVSDTLLFASKIQTTLLVVHGSKTPRKPVVRCVQLLRNAGANLGGIVLNQLPHRRGKGYYYYYDSYYYGYGKDGKAGGKRRRSKHAKPASASEESLEKKQV